MSHHDSCDTLRRVIGTVVAHRYEVREPLGRGGIGRAFRVFDRLGEGEVALKLVGRDALALQTLQREFVALRAVHHPRITRVFDFGYHHEPGKATRPFYTSAIARGVGLGDYARKRSWREIARALADVLSALDALHRRGIVHGDVHPDNVLVDQGGRATLLDLSCCRRIGERSELLSGRPGFLAPELPSAPASPTADLYAFGVTLGGLVESLSGPPEASVVATLARLLAGEPDRRIQSAAECAELLGVPWEATTGTDLLTTRLVGRDAAIETLRAALDAVASGSPGPRVVSICGPEGVGRSRLLEEFRIEAQLRMDAAQVSGVKKGALAALLGAALGRPKAPAILGALRAVDELGGRARPIVLSIDDADDLSREEREQLAAIARMTPHSGALLVVLAVKDPSIVPESHASVVLEPLSGSDLRAWLRSGIPEGSVDSILRATSGYPREISALVAHLDQAAWDSRSLERAMLAAGTARGPLHLASLDEPARHALGIVAAALPVLEPSLADRLVAPEVLADLAARGFLARGPEGDRLARRSDVSRIRDALGPAAMRAAEHALADGLRELLEQNPDREDLRSRLIVQLAAMDPAAGWRRLSEAAAAAPQTLRPAVDALLTSPDVATPEALACAIEIYAESGEPLRGLSIAARALRARPQPKTRLLLRRLAGQCYAQAGDSRRAVRLLARMLPATVGTSEHAPLAAALSLALLKCGRDLEASSVARAALDDATDGEPRLDLLVNAAFATSRVGSLASARELASAARELAERVRTSPRRRFRIASLTAFLAYRSGDAAAATRAYRETLDLAEENGLDDLVASAASNYGTACHQQGHLGRAIEAYERGRRIALALGMPTTEVTLCFNLARVHADIGSFDRATQHAEATRARARAEEMAILEAGACAILAEIASSRNDHALAMRHLDEAERSLGGKGDRELVELRVQRAKCELAAGDHASALRCLTSIESAARAVSAPDVLASWLGTRARARFASGERHDVLEDLERATDLATSCDQRGLVAELSLWSAEAHADAGSSFLEARDKNRARELCERMLATLPVDLQAPFRRHPMRRVLFTESRDAAPTPETASPFDPRRILEINRRLNSAVTTDAVLEETMDVAIELAKAERGFLLLAKEQGGADTLKVAIARNIDRENLRHGHLKFSRTVAERVVRTNEPVFALDPAFDPRFTKARSVHALRLKSLLCVPIRSPKKTLGAIYVDHRFSATGVRPELVEMMLSLADQAALAILHARLVDELRTKTAELEERNAEIERLARGQALEIARLKRAMDDDARASTRRFDYGTMVAVSPAMRRVLAVLDRVIDADVTVLVRGESGTGKESVARAIHANSPRASGPFVAINCGALPEALLEAELFGYCRGAFSGAVRDHPGLFVGARGGTLFLDELGEMPPAMQVKLLRVLQEKEVRPLGAAESVATDVRVVCATNRVLRNEIAEGRFREDLYYRVAVVELELPPLRDRVEDVLPIADQVLDRLARELHRPRATLDRGAERALLSHPWPGNVRELENVLTKAYLLAPRAILTAQDLALAERGPGRVSAASALRTRIVGALEATDWNVVAASRVLEMPRATLYRKMRRFGIVRPSGGFDVS